MKINITEPEKSDGSGEEMPAGGRERVVGGGKKGKSERRGRGVRVA